MEKQNIKDLKYKCSAYYNSLGAYKKLKTTPCSEYALNAIAIDEQLEYARLYLEGNMQMWVDAEDSLELW